MHYLFYASTRSNSNLCGVEAIVATTSLKLLSLHRQQQTVALLDILCFSSLETNRSLLTQQMSVLPTF